MCTGVECQRLWCGRHGLLMMVVPQQKLDRTLSELNGLPCKSGNAQVVAGATLGTVGLLLVYAPNDNTGIGVRRLQLPLLLARQALSHATSSSLTTHPPVSLFAMGACTTDHAVPTTTGTPADAGRAHGN